MKTIKKTIRTCMGCNTEHMKNEMLRIVRTTEGNVKVDFSGKLNGRGAYICNDINCLDRAVKNKRLQKSLKIEIPDNIFEQLKREISRG